MPTRTAAERAERARALGPTDLVLSSLTVPRATVAERVAAAAEAGYAGIALHLANWKRLQREGWTTERVADILDRHDQLLVEIEFLQSWAGPPSMRERAAEEERLAFELAAGLGARHLQLGGPYHADVDAAAEAFAGVCDRAAEHGLLVSLEYLPEMTNIGSAAEALVIVERAGRPNGGICVDSWHHERGPDTLATLAHIDGARVTSVQLDDGRIPRTEPDYLTDTSTNRLPPGEGDFDLVGLLHTLRAMGVRAPLGLEVISPAVAAAHPSAVARRVADGMRAVLARADGSAATA
ncbi:MAG: sugar phosphate isomerase/epimerase family protein [Acidimicrobiia bacterium]